MTQLELFPIETDLSEMDKLLQQLIWRTMSEYNVPWIEACQMVKEAILSIPVED